jgi:hypothetical protein
VTIAVGDVAPGLATHGITPFVGDLHLVGAAVEAPLVRILPDAAQGWAE